MPPDALPTLHRLLESRVERKADTGTVGYVSLGEDEFDVVVGDNGAGAALTADTVVPWTCSSKPLGALAFAELWEAGEVGLDDPVARHLPDYGTAGKERVTIRNLLTHTTGVSDEPIVYDAALNRPETWAELDERLWKAICAAAVEHPHSVMTYNMVANWFVLERVLSSVTGSSSVERYGALLEHCGAAGATLGLAGDVAGDQRVTMYGAEPREALEVTFLQPLVQFPIPGTGVWGPIRSLGRVGEVLLAEGAANGHQVVRPPTVAALTATQLAAPESYVDGVLPYGFGVVTAPGVFGRDCSHRAFGHSGGNTSLLVVDPEHRLVAAFYWNGRVSSADCIPRHHATIGALYEDLGLRLPPPT